MKTFYKASLVFLSCGLLIFNDAFAQAPNWAWAKKIGRSATQSMAVDASGNTYTIGFFGETVDFDPGPDTFNLTPPNLAIYILKLDASGNFIWAKAFMGLSGFSFINYFKVAVDDAGNVYGMGIFWGTVDFDPGIGAFNLTATDSTFGDIFISKLDSSGNFVWAKTIDGSSVMYCSSIITDTRGNIYTTGYFYGTIDFDPDTVTYNLTSTAGSSDIFICKWDSSGNFKWAKSIGGTNYDLSNSIAVDVSGNLYTTGSFYDTVDFDPGPGTFNLTAIGVSKAFILKLDSSGNFIWAKIMEGASVGNCITTDKANNIYTTGSFMDSTDFDPGTGTYILYSPDSFSVSIFISKLDSLGNFIWAKAIIGTGEMGYQFMSLDSYANVYLAGSFGENATFDFDPSAGVYNLTSGWYWDVYLSKFDSTGNFGWAKVMGGSEHDECTSVAVDGANNVYINGFFYSPTIAFDSTILVNSDSLSGPNYDGFIAKINNYILTETSFAEYKNIISVYPNPTTTSCTITAPNFTNTTLVIYDITGRALSQQPFNSKATINISGLTNGIYIAEIKNKQGSSAVGKVVKE